MWGRVALEARAQARRLDDDPRQSGWASWGDSCGDGVGTGLGVCEGLIWGQCLGTPVAASDAPPPDNSFPSAEHVLTASVQGTREVTAALVEWAAHSRWGRQTASSGSRAAGAGGGRGKVVSLGRAGREGWGGAGLERSGGP